MTSVTSISSLPPDEIEGEELTKIADGRYAGPQRVQRVLQPRREADHKITEVRLDRRGLAEQRPVTRSEPGTGLLHGAVTIDRGHAHGPVERKSEPVEPIATFVERRVDFGQGEFGRPPRREANVSVVHHVASGSLGGLVRELGGVAGRPKQCRRPQSLRRGSATGDDQL